MTALALRALDLLVYATGAWTLLWWAAWFVLGLGVMPAEVAVLGYLRRSLRRRGDAT